MLSFTTAGVGEQLEEIDLRWCCSMQLSVWDCKWSTRPMHNCLFSKLLCSKWLD